MKDTISGISIRSLFAKNLKRLRLMAKISQVGLSVETGLTHNFINDIENGKKWVSPESIAKLAKALRAEPYQFFIADPKYSSQGAEMLSIYLDNFEESCSAMIKEFRSRYLDGTEDDVSASEEKV